MKLNKMFTLALFKDNKYTVCSKKSLRQRGRTASAPYKTQFFKCETFTFHEDDHLLETLAANISKGVPVVRIENQQVKEWCGTTSKSDNIESEVFEVCMYCGVLSQNAELPIKENHTGSCPRILGGLEPHSNTNSGSNNSERESLTGSNFSDVLEDGSCSVAASETSESSNFTCVSETLSNIEIETPAPYGILDIHSVAPSGRGGKRYFCKFCFKMVTKIARHLETVHKDEKEVKSFSVLPKGCPERQKIIHLLRSSGSFIYNTNSAYNKGDLLVSRRPRANLLRNPKDFECCPKCKASFSKLTLRHHASKCLNEDYRRERSVVIMGKRVRAALHPAASTIVKDQIFPYLREDTVVACIRYDELVIRFSNHLCLKYRSSHHHKMIRSQLRLIGRFLFRIKEIDNTVKTMSDVFHPKKFDTVLKVIGYLGEYDEQNNVMRKPNVPLHMGTLLKKLGNFYNSECIKRSDEVSQKIVGDFLTLIASDFNAEITQTALESRLDMQRKKKVELPPDSDVHKFLVYILKNVKRCNEELSRQYTSTSWKELASFSLLWTICFNRRRVGEVERMKIVDFNLNHGIDKVADHDIYRSLSAEGKKAARNFRRVSLRGKLGRTVHLLLCRLVFKSIQMVLKYRHLAGVTEANPYVFGIPGREHKFIEACSLIRMHSQKCGASRPKLLRGTHLRKHIATQSVLLNLTDIEVSDLANYMGHDEKIHKSHYRLPIVAREITEISKLLQKAQGVSDCGDSSGDELDQASNSESSSESDEDILPYSSPSNQSPPDETFNTSKISYREEIAKYLPSEKKTPWKASEIEAVRDTFKEYLLENRVPTMSQCCLLRVQNADLHNRSPQAIRSFIAGDIKRNSNCNADLFTPKKLVCHRKRWSTLEEALLQDKFQSYYSSGTLPSLKVCKQVIEENCILRDRTPEVVKAKINNDFKKQSKRV